jgi:ankyrin repeat protein
MPSHQTPTETKWQSYARQEQENREAELHNPKWALHLAARDCDIDKLTELTNANPHDLELQDYQLGTPLQTAIFNNHVQAVQILLSAGADPYSLAPDECGDLRDTALQLAARLGYRDIAKVLWNYGCSHHINAKGEHCTPFELAAWYGFDQLVWEFLLWRDQWGSSASGFAEKEMASALWRAASRWEVGVVEVLLERFQFKQDALNLALFSGVTTKRMLPYENLTRTPYTNLDSANQGKVVELLLSAGAYSNSRNWSGEHVLHVAAKALETTEALRVLLQHDADPNATDANGQTPLSIATSKLPARAAGFREYTHHIEGVRLLLQHGASVTIEDSFGETPIYKVARNWSMLLLKLCLQNCGTELPKTSYGETLLHAAAAGNQVEIVRVLLHAGVDANETSSCGWSALMFSASLEITRLLVSHGADVTATSDSGLTALHLVANMQVCSQESAEVARTLLSIGSNIESPATVPKYGLRFPNPTTSSIHGRMIGHRVEDMIAQYEGFPVGLVRNQTPLHFAAKTGLFDIVSLLLRYGANPTARDSVGSTPAHSAAYSPIPTLYTYPLAQRQQIIKLLLENGASLEVENKDGVSIRNWAVTKGLPLEWRQW